MKKIILSLLLISNSALAHSLDLSLSPLLIKSRDLQNKGEYNSSTNSLNVGVNVDLIKFQKPFQSIFIHGSYQSLKFGSQKSISFYDYGVGYKVKPNARLLIEASAGLKDFYYFYTQSANVFLDKKSNVYLKVKADYAFTKIENINIIGDALTLYCISTDKFKCHEVGVGLSAGFSTGDLYQRIGYRLEHQYSYDLIEANSIFKNVLYYKINF